MKPLPCVDAILRGQVPRWIDVGVSAAEFLECCSALEVSVLVHDRLKRSTGANDWPDDVRRELERRARSTTARELVRAREIRGVLDALATPGIVPILLKGVALAHTVYDSPAMRPHIDTDLLIAREHIEPVRDVFARRGYLESALTDGELVFCQFQMAKVDGFGVDHVFDVHWRISTQTLFADLLTYQELRADAVEIPALGPHAVAACDLHALLLACVHPVMHHRNTDRLIWLYDVDRLARHLSVAEFQDFARLAVGKEVAEVCARQLSTAVERFHTPVPSSVANMLVSARPAEPTAVYLRPHRRWHHELFWNVRALQGWSDRLRLLREVLFPSAQYMLNSYHLGSRGAVLLPALYVHRCAYGAFKILVGRK